MLKPEADGFTPSDIQVLKTYGAAPYAASLKALEKEIKDLQQKVNEKIGMDSILGCIKASVANHPQVSRYGTAISTVFNCIDHLYRNRTPDWRHHTFGI